MNFSTCAATLLISLTLLTSGGRTNAQTPGKLNENPDQSGQPLESPAATATVQVGGGTILIKYNSPRMRGRTIMGGLVPYGTVWRTGANPATTIITSVPLMFGGLLVPTGTHTLYTLPTKGTWQLIINNQTGQWGTEYDQTKDLGRVPMQSRRMKTPKEAMSISFEKSTRDSTELHVRWETTDQYITITPARCSKPSWISDQRINYML